MGKLTVEELRALRDKMKVDLRRREVAGKDIQVIVGMGDCGFAAGAKATMDTFFKVLDEQKLLDKVLVRQVGSWMTANRSPLWKWRFPECRLLSMAALMKTWPKKLYQNI